MHGEKTIRCAIMIMLLLHALSFSYWTGTVQCSIGKDRKVYVYTIIMFIQILYKNQLLNSHLQTKPAHFSVSAVVVVDSFGISMEMLLIIQ